MNLAIVQHHRELCAARVEIEPTALAMVHEPGHVLLARVAVPLCAPRRPRHELERALGVERVRDRGGWDGAVHVEVEVARRALVARANPDFLAPITLERELRVLEPEPVVGVAEVEYLGVFHGSAGWLVWLARVSPKDTSPQYFIWETYASCMLKRWT